AHARQGGAIRRQVDHAGPPADRDRRPPRRAAPAALEAHVLALGPDIGLLEEVPATLLAAAQDQRHLVRFHPLLFFRPLGASYELYSSTTIVRTSTFSRVFGTDPARRTW